MNGCADLFHITFGVDHYVEKDLYENKIKRGYLDNVFKITSSTIVPSGIMDFRSVEAVPVILRIAHVHTNDVEDNCFLIYQQVEAREIQKTKNSRRRIHTPPPRRARIM